jgi:hypothetical protein
MTVYVVQEIDGDGTSAIRHVFLSKALADGVAAAKNAIPIEDRRYDYWVQECEVEDS